jgi:signal transduction histidine kinase
MELKRRNFLVYGLFVALWGLVAAWQWADHVRVRQLAHEELIHRARDVSGSVATTMRAFRRFGGVVSRDRLETALTEMLRPGEWNGIALLNEAGTIVASAGTVDIDLKGAPAPPEVWGEKTVILFNPVALGTNVTRDLEGTNLPVVVDFPRRSETNRPPVFGPGPRPGESPDDHPPDRPPDDHGAPPRVERERDRNVPEVVQSGGASTNSFRGRGGPGRPRFTRPPWWSEEEWKTILEKQGVHSFAIVMSTQRYREATNRDLWLRSIIVLLAAVSVVGMALAWESLARTSDLQLRLVRTSELNTHLKEMNLAAAGLAHETRNPLNIIRGMAQMIGKQTNAPTEIREQSRAIVNESDKVTAQLNEFINYSRPREVRRSPLALNAIIAEVVRALSYDIQEKKILLEVKGERIAIEADEQLLRQVLFNLVINAIQAVGGGGEIQILTQRRNASEGSIEIRDNGPGVPPERRAEIFKPYFTTQAKGTGLGLAIVQQNVLAHGWEIEVLANEPKGAIFRVTHLKLAKS